MTILRAASRTITVDESLVLEESASGRAVYEGTRFVCDESDSQLAWAARVALRLPRTFDRVAHLGGGFCVLARLLVGRCEHQDVYELIPELAQGIIDVDAISFIAGRWQDTLTGTYDVIVLDTGEELTDRLRDTLNERLAEGGKLIAEGV